LGIDDAEIVGIAGPNGAGKSTLFDILSGHVRPDSGTVSIDGKDVSAVAAHGRARLGLGRTFQSPIVPTELTVEEVLDAARAAWRPEVDHNDVEAVCELLAFDTDQERLAGSLDTLARRKLLLACLLIRRPLILLLDEPCSGLLGDEIDEMESIITRARDQTGVAVVVVEHRLELLMAIAHRVIVMDQGTIIAEGTATDVFAAPAVRAAYFTGAATSA
jgi:branched-chain amino acid transport system ATP-binding protein